MALVAKPLLEDVPSAVSPRSSFRCGGQLLTLLSFLLGLSCAVLFFGFRFEAPSPTSVVHVGDGQFSADMEPATTLVGRLMRPALAGQALRQARAPLQQSIQARMWHSTRPAMPWFSLGGRLQSLQPVNAGIEGYDSETTKPPSERDDPYFKQPEKEPLLDPDDPLKDEKLLDLETPVTGSWRKGATFIVPEYEKEQLGWYSEPTNDAGRQKYPGANTYYATSVYSGQMPEGGGLAFPGTNIRVDSDGVSFPVKATCELRDNIAAEAALGEIPGRTGVSGKVTLTQVDEETVKMEYEISGLKPGKHGFSIHEKCDFSRGCNSCGSHYNPFRKLHGAPDELERHVGSLGNIEADASGVAKGEKTDKLVKLFGEYSVIGRSIVIGANPDDEGRGNPIGLAATTSVLANPADVGIPSARSARISASFFNRDALNREVTEPRRALWFLLFDSDVIAVCTDNIMEVGRKILASEDRGMAAQIVASTLRKLSADLEAQTPEIALELHESVYDDREKAAVLVLLGLLRDREVQSMGVRMARQIRTSPSAESAEIRRALERHMRENAREVRALRQEKVPDVVRHVLWDVTSRDQWELTLDPENLQSMGRSSLGELEPTELYPSFTSASPYPSYEKKYFAISGGAIEQGRAFIDIVQKLSRSRGPHVTTQVFNTELDREAEWPCAPQKAMRSNTDFMKALICPLKFGAQGLDALRASKELDALRAATSSGQDSVQVSVTLPGADSQPYPSASLIA